MFRDMKKERTNAHPLKGNNRFNWHGHFCAGFQCPHSKECSQYFPSEFLDPLIFSSRNDPASGKMFYIDTTQVKLTIGFFLFWI